MTTIFLLISVCHMSADAEWSTPRKDPASFFHRRDSDGPMTKCHLRTKMSLIDDTLPENSPQKKKNMKKNNVWWHWWPING